MISIPLSFPAKILCSVLIFQKQVRFFLTPQIQESADPYAFQIIAEQERRAVKRREKERLRAEKAKIQQVQAEKRKTKAAERAKVRREKAEATRQQKAKGARKVGELADRSS